jgi:hypothetical protein
MGEPEQCLELTLPKDEWVMEESNDIIPCSSMVNKPSLQLCAKVKAELMEAVAIDEAAAHIQRKQGHIKMSKIRTIWVSVLQPRTKVFGFGKQLQSLTSR